MMNKEQALNNLKIIKPSKDLWAYNNLLQYITFEPKFDIKLEESINYFKNRNAFELPVYDEPHFKVILQALNTMQRELEDNAKDKHLVAEEIIKDATLILNQQVKLDKIRKVLKNTMSNQNIYVDLINGILNDGILNGDPDEK